MIMDRWLETICVIKLFMCLKKKSLIFKCHFSEELIALIVNLRITRYLRITKPER